ncbi:MAG TPA: uracil-DNA glycosylase [Candidatus Hydrogenedentes bacterium]|nr:uracil-DNA glycosylase [Candidatus Hydrogenedentota bacterium]HOS02218.1 uracil-DNA glycosylase [Candidatus Hydrogenedentota bacterium]
MNTDSWQDLLAATRELAKTAAGRRGVISVSPDIAAWLAQPAEAAAELAALEQTVAACTQCALHKTRTQTVFSDGNPAARLVFVGEAPGADEDQQGIPFVGKAGQLLTAIIEKGMGLRRSDVYICNVLKCRPPDNRDPLPEEAELCEPYLMRQIELVKPRAICVLGRHAVRSLLRTEEGIGKLRGRWHFYMGIPVRVTYHPSYLLRNPGDKRKVWMDVLEVMKVYKGEINPTPDNPNV